MGRRVHGAAGAPALRAGRSAPGRCRCRRSTRRSCARSARALDALRPRLPLPALRGGASACRSRWAASAACGARPRLAQLPPARRWLSDRLKPGRRARAPSSGRKSWFSVRFVGEGGGRRVFTEVSRRRPRLRRDGEDARRVGALPGLRRPARRPPGQVTTAVAMGDALIERLRRGGDHASGWRRAADRPGGAVTADRHSDAMHRVDHPGRSRRKPASTARISAAFTARSTGGAGRRGASGHGASSCGPACRSAGGRTSVRVLRTSTQSRTVPPGAPAGTGRPPCGWSPGGGRRG